MPPVWFRSNRLGSFALGLRRVLMPIRSSVKEALAVLQYQLRDSENRLIYQKAVECGFLRVGRHTYGLPKILWYRDERGLIEIGNFCSIAEEVTIFLGGNHRPWVTTYPIGDPFGRPDLMENYGLQDCHIVIGSDVWIGYGATILGGVRIGDGVIIGARAVVASDIPPFAIVVGNPARVIRYRFDPPAIEALLNIRWWDWGDEQIREALPLLASPDICSFTAQYGHDLNRTKDSIE